MTNRSIDQSMIRDGIIALENSRGNLADAGIVEDVFLAMARNQQNAPQPSNRISFAWLRQQNDLASIDSLAGEDWFLLQDDLRERAAQLDNDSQFFKAMIKDKFGSRVDDEYKAKQADTGTVRLSIDTADQYELKAEKKKVVIWSQDQLSAFWDKIAKSNDDPAIYIQRVVSTSYKVDENTYKKWPESIQSAFASARTVKPGNATFTIVEAKKGE